MGIQRIDAPHGQAAKPVIENDENYIFKLAGSRKSGRAPERHRGIWSFLVSPFIFSSLIALESAKAKGNAWPGEGEDDAATNPTKHSGGAAPVSPDDQSAAVSHAADESAADQTGSSGYPTSRVQSADAAAQEDVKKTETARTPDPAPTITPPDGGGGGGGDDTRMDDNSNRADDQNALDALGKSAVTLLDQPHGTPALPITIDAAASGLHVDIGSGGAPLLANILPSAALGATLDFTPLNLKDMIGFDVHLGSDGSFAEVGLGDTIDPNISIPQTVHAIGSVVDELPVINVNAANVLDDLFGSVGGQSPAHLTSHIDAHNALATLDTAATAVTDTSIKLTGTLNATLPHADPALTVSGTSELPHASTLEHVLGNALGETGIMSTGSSIDFPAATPPAGDILFSGHHYTDYHVALQTTDPGSSSITSSVSSSIHTSIETVATQLPDTPPASHETPNGQANMLPAATHADQPVNQLVHTLDDLSLRAGGH
jgi:hypothetical protein